MNTPSVDDYRPMMPDETSIRPFTDAQWQYEIKYDGYRVLAGVGPGVQLRTRNGRDCTAWFPEVATALRTLPAGEVIDGEVCVLDELGRSDFNRIQARARRRRWYDGCDQVTLCAFDILVHEGREVTGLPLTKRKTMLKALLAGVPKQALLFVGELPADKALFEQVVLGLKLEGFVAKRKASIYVPGTRTLHWRKLKRPGWQEGRRWVG